MWDFYQKRTEKFRIEGAKIKKKWGGTGVHDAPESGYPPWEFTFFQIHLSIEDSASVYVFTAFGPSIGINSKEDEYDLDASKGVLWYRRL